MGVLLYKLGHMDSEESGLENFDDTRTYDFDDDIVNLSKSSDFDGYKNKGYIPGYSDVGLYGKDGRPPFSSPLGVTQRGLLMYGTKSDFATMASRGDNIMAEYNQRLQGRSKENLIRQTRNGPRTVSPYLLQELKSNEHREWWNQDNLYDRIQRLE